MKIKDSEDNLKGDYQLQINKKKIILSKIN